MAFKLKTGKTVNKVLAGAGIATLLGVGLSAVAPGIAGSTMGKVIEGAAAAMFLGHSVRSFTGANALDNVQTESL